jgi:hypothetical protein
MSKHGIPPRPEVPTYKSDLPILHGFCTIQVFEQVGEEGDKWEQRGLQTIIDADNFQELNKYPWFWIWNPERNSHYVMRVKQSKDGSLCWIEMGSEILRLHSERNN